MSHCDWHDAFEGDDVSGEWKKDKPVLGTAGFGRGSAFPISLHGLMSGKYWGKGEVGQGGIVLVGLMTEFTLRCVGILGPCKLQQQLILFTLLFRI
jgi:hypothetical protein